MKKSVLLSVDIEADGHIPGKNSMLSMGCVALTLDKVCLGQFSRNFETLPNATTNSEVMKFWDKNQFAYEETRKNTVSPEEGMKSFDSWMSNFKNYKLFLGSWPVAYDFMWVYWYYCYYFNKKPPFGHSGFDSKTAASLMLNLDYRNVGKRNTKKWLDNNTKHNHIALTDALDAGAQIINMIRDNNGWATIPTVKFSKDAIDDIKC